MFNSSAAAIVPVETSQARKSDMNRMLLNMHNSKTHTIFSSA